MASIILLSSIHEAIQLDNFKLFPSNLTKFKLISTQITTMAQLYAKSQPKGFTNYIQNIAIVGAGGTIGKFIVASLLAQGKHTITAITRPSSTSSLPRGLHSIKKAEYDDHSALVSALQGQEVLIITLNVMAPPDSQKRLINAAVEAGVKYVMPNEYSADYSNASLAEDSLLGPRAFEIRRHIESVGKGKTHWIALSSSFWYEHSLGGGEERYGFDFEKKKLTLLDDGNTKICTITWKQSGEAVAKLFALKVLPEDEGDRSLTLSRFEDGAVLVSSFVVSQRDMFESVLRVTGDRESDWMFVKEDSKERYKVAQELMKSKDQGEWVKGYVMVLYTRVFFPNGGGDFWGKIVNEGLGLSQESLDDATRETLKLRKEGYFDKK